MSTVQFEPKITTDLQIDWRRHNAGAGADAFTDLLAEQMKRRADADRQALDTHRSQVQPHHDSPDPLSGRNARVTIAHPKTLRGEARHIDEHSERSLPDQSAAKPDCPTDESTTKTAGDPAAPGEATAG